LFIIEGFKSAQNSFTGLLTSYALAVNSKKDRERRSIDLIDVRYIKSTAILFFIINFIIRSE
jgi:hypothetical protein